MLKELFASLKFGLSVWSSKEARRYLDKLSKLETDFYEEYNKVRPDHAVLDNIEFKLRQLRRNAAAEAGIENAVDSP